MSQPNLISFLEEVMDYLALGDLASAQQELETYDYTIQVVIADSEKGEYIALVNQLIVKLENQQYRQHPVLHQGLVKLLRICDVPEGFTFPPSLLTTMEN
ncbi:MAG: hypothetical protein H6765_00255 [Candidatus Peribacteria bacterium]|nr:MAG: hypothetical protein H6765_00255 [Candidatus Peribacteria bacterium]